MFPISSSLAGRAVAGVANVCKSDRGFTKSFDRLVAKVGEKQLLELHVTVKTFILPPRLPPPSSELKHPVRFTPADLRGTSGKTTGVLTRNTCTMICQYYDSEPHSLPVTTTEQICRLPPCRALFTEEGGITVP